MPSGTLLITFTLYLVVMIAVGYWSYRRTVNLSDFVLGGRRLGSLPAALSAGASDMSGWLLLGLPGFAYAAGLQAAWIALGLFIGTWLNWHLVAKRLRRFTYALHDSLTLPDYFERRFEDSSHRLRVTSATVILFFFTFYTSSGLVAGGKLFATVFGLPYEWAVICGAVAVVSYTLFGGFLAVVWTDVIQGLLMLAALILVPIMALSTSGGFGAVVSDIRAINPALLDLWRDASGEPLGILAIASLLAWGLGYFGQPHILARFKAIRSESEVPRATAMAVSWSGLTLLGALACGWLAIAYLQTPPDDSERVFMLLVQSLFHPLVAGVLLAAILAAIMSTADSQLLVASSALTEDFYRALWKRDASTENLILVGRLAVLVVALVATAMALNPDSQVLGLVSYAWAGFGGVFGPLILLSLYWPRMNAAGALAGLIAGAVTVVVWKSLSGGWFDLYEIVPAFISTAVLAVLITRFTGGAEESLQRRFQQLVKPQLLLDS